LYCVQRGGSGVSREQLHAIEVRDAELAQLMQDEEKLKRHRSRQQNRHQHARQVSDIGPQPHSEAVMTVINCALSDLMVKRKAFINMKLKYCNGAEPSYLL